MRYCSTKSLQVGSILARPILTEDGRTLLCANTELSTFLISRLRNLGYVGVYIYDDMYDDIVPEGVLSLDTQMKVLTALSNLNIDSCMYLSNKIVDDIHSCDLIDTDLSALLNYDTYTYQHSLNVAVYCGVLGFKLGFTIEKTKDLVLAAMLHDIGKMFIPKEIITKAGPLTEEERDKINEHPQLGYKFLQENSRISSKTKVAVLEHHENYDGSGYPLGIYHEDIYSLAMIIHVCDVYDAMISKRSYKDSIPPSEVIEYLMSKCGTMFDLDIVSVFIKNLVVFPNGSQVRLSDDRSCIVVRNNDNYPLRPVVRDNNGNDIDLLEANNITILDFDM